MSSRLDPKPVKRRDFLSLSGLGAAGAAILGSTVGMARLPKPRVTPEASTRFRAGKPGDYLPGTATVLDAQNVRVISTDKGLAAVSLICTHLGCIVSATEDGYACPCHGSKFNERGDVVGGPAPRGLPWLAVSRAPDGSVVIDTASEVEPETYVPFV